MSSTEGTEAQILKLATLLGIPNSKLKEFIASQVPNTESAGSTFNTGSTESAETPGSTKASTPKKSTDKNPCEHIIKGKTGDRMCEVNSKNSVGGKWYCSKHYTSYIKKTITSEATAVESVASAANSAVARGSRTAGVSAVSAANAVGAKPKIIEKISKTDKITLVETPPGSGRFIDKLHRIIISPTSGCGGAEAYGVLAADDTTILPFSDVHIRFLEAHNISFKIHKQEEVPLIEEVDDDEGEDIKSDIDEDEPNAEEGEDEEGEEIEEEDAEEESDEDEEGEDEDEEGEDA